MPWMLIIHRKGTDNYLIDRYPDERSAKEAMQDLLGKLTAPASAERFDIHLTKSGSVMVKEAEFVSAEIRHTPG